MKNIFAISLLIFVLSSCGLIFSGTKQKVSIKDGYPAAADVYYNGSYQGQAPLKVKIPKKAMKDEGAKITIKSDGYEPQDVTFDRRVNVGAFVFDVIFGAIWLVPDYLTGAIYKGSPKKIEYKLTPVKQ